MALLILFVGPAVLACPTRPGVGESTMSWDTLVVDDADDLKGAVRLHVAMEVGVPASSIEKVLERAGVFYAAVKEGRAVSACVVHVREGEEGFEASVYSEIEGPVEAQCPLGILRLLTKTDVVEAVAWRERCWEWNEAVVNLVIDGPAELAQAIAERHFGRDS